ncbi:hypothetical protein V2I28_03130 [Campylobacter sp. CX2-4080-23]|uniref:hypothetical protein n=1 Tax=Campylobacter porcelli TaxID=1660073 RepID=UPI002EA1CFC8|nr:hypothetical protein [Campylobacter sp. CX2-4080-23]
MSIITKSLKSSGYIVLNKHLMRILGVNKTIILSLFIDKADYYDNQMFFYTIEDISEALGGGMSEREIRATIKSLIDENLVIDKGMLGIPAKRFFLINEIKISELFDSARDSKNETNIPFENETPSPCKNERARNSKNDSANIINPNNTNPNIPNPNILKEKNIKKESSSNFQKPSLDELENYAKEIEANFSVNHFFDYYEANGWKVGKNPMKSWQATMRMWNARSSENKSNIDDKKLDEFFASQKSDPVLSNNWLSRGVPGVVKSKNQALENKQSDDIPQDFKDRFLGE